ncbi:hypothetical protein AMAG_11510 [Allomyces macrogynus ATCC 38327]|uniref:Uncharacterized protein n=1 Tax=Allomyces macrogynus (strain ATCC 38327) TaxID=578462 RepID=A0A0L0SV23_ALLM3|nr:hypothetical protein AMAG_11510 [Allomyces macrogynus ATCC 38327]|eukprot:KNE66367.1 hypothetical protein AMAG_11510 [Allomyces macrogynus ATCC 38327]
MPTLGAAQCSSLVTRDACEAVPASDTFQCYWGGLACYLGVKCPPAASCSSTPGCHRCSDSLPDLCFPTVLPCPLPCNKYTNEIQCVGWASKRAGAAVCAWSNGACTLVGASIENGNSSTAGIVVGAIAAVAVIAAVAFVVYRRQKRGRASPAAATSTSRGMRPPASALPFPVSAQPIPATSELAYPASAQPILPPPPAVTTSGPPATSTTPTPSGASTPASMTLARSNATPIPAERTTSPVRPPSPVIPGASPTAAVLGSSTDAIVDVPDSDAGTTNGDAGGPAIPRARRLDSEGSSSSNGRPISLNSTTVGEYETRKGYIWPQTARFTMISLADTSSDTAGTPRDEEFPPGTTGSSPPRDNGAAVIAARAINPPPLDRRWSQGAALSPSSPYSMSDIGYYSEVGVRSPAEDIPGVVPDAGAVARGRSRSGSSGKGALAGAQRKASLRMAAAARAARH